MFDGNPGLTKIDIDYGTTGWGATYLGLPVRAVDAPLSLRASPPNVVSAELGDGRVTFGISASQIASSPPIAGYEYSVDEGATWKAVDASSTPSTVVISGLTNGTRYVIKLRAINLLGRGLWTRGRAVTPIAAASAPKITKVTTGFKKLTVEFDAPTNNGGSPITRYCYSLNGGKWISFATLAGTQIIRPLDNGVKYSVRIKALNAVGGGAISDAVEATPQSISK